jgi:hypothetical protein
MFGGSNWFVLGKELLPLFKGVDERLPSAKENQSSLFMLLG